MIQTQINKRLVEQSFRKSLQTYNQHAVVQNQICSKLLHALVEYCGTIFNQVLEIGAGTGLLTEKMLQQLVIKKLIINDLVQSTQLQLSKILRSYCLEQNFVMGDAESIVLPINNNLIISTSTVQWFENLPSFFEKCNMLLDSNGLLAFSTFGENNMTEIGLIEGKTLTYASISDLQKEVSKHFEILWKMDEQITLYFNTPKEILKHIKQTGVNGIESTRWTKKDLLHFSSNYQQFYVENKGYTLTYHPVYFICKKK